MTKHVHGGNIYTYRNCLDFSANCNPLGTPESVKQAIRDSLEQKIIHRWDISRSKRQLQHMRR